MSIISKLATSLNRRDERPNQDLAKHIAATKDKASVKELTELLKHKNKAIQSDAIKVLYEVGELQPTLIVPYLKDFLALLQGKNNRNIWGAMHAIDSMTAEVPKQVYANLPAILAAAAKGSVITKDHTVGILLKLSAIRQYSEDCFLLFLEILQTCATNQLPMYAENAMSIINDKNKSGFIHVLRKRIPEIDKESKLKRIEKLLRKLDKGT